MNKLSLEELLNLAVGVRDASSDGENTAEKVGSVLVELVRNIADAPEFMVLGNSFSTTTSDSNFVINFQVKDFEGGISDKKITIPSALADKAGLFTPAILAEIKQLIKEEAQRATKADNELSAELLKRIQGTSPNSDSMVDAFKQLGNLASYESLNTLLDTLLYDAEIVGRGFGYYRAKVNNRDIEIKNILLSSSLNVIIQVVSGVLVIKNNQLAFTDEKYSILMRRHINNAWSDWSVCADSTSIEDLHKSIDSMQIDLNNQAEQEDLLQQALESEILRAKREEKALRDALEEECASNVDAFAQVQSQFEEHQLIAVTSEDVRSIRKVTDAQHKEMEDKGELRDDTLYIIEDKDYVEDGDDSEFAQLRKKVAALSGKSGIRRETKSILDAFKSISIKHIPLSCPIEYKFCANIDVFAPLVLKLGTQLQIVIDSNKAEFYVGDFSVPYYTKDFLWDDYKGDFFGKQITAFVKFSHSFSKLRCNLRVYSGSNTANDEITIPMIDEDAVFDISTKQSGIFSSCVLISRLYNFDSITFSNYQKGCSSGAVSVGYPSMTTDTALEIMRHILNYTIPGEIVWAVGSNEADDVCITAISELLKICSDYGIHPTVCTHPNSEAYSNTVKNAYIRTLSNVDVVDVALFINGSENSTSWPEGYWDSEKNLPTSDAETAMFNFIYL